MSAEDSGWFVPVLILSPIEAERVISLGLARAEDVIVSPPVPVDTAEPYPACRSRSAPRHP